MELRNTFIKHWEDDNLTYPTKSDDGTKVVEINEDVQSSSIAASNDMQFIDYRDPNSLKSYGDEPGECPG